MRIARCVPSAETFFLSTSSASSASLWFIAKAMFQQWLLFGSPGPRRGTARLKPFLTPAGVSIPTRPRGTTHLREFTNSCPFVVLETGQLNDK